jgi:hypothetical protein
MENPRIVNPDEYVTKFAQVSQSEIGKVYLLHVRDILNKDSIWRQLVVKKHMQTGPDSRLDVSDCSIEVRNDPSQKPLALSRA